MNEMRKLMEAVQHLNEESVLVNIAREVSDWCGEVITPEDLAVYSDGMSYAILCKPTGEQFLYSSDGEGGWELEDADFGRWPPKVHAHYGTALRKVTEQKLDEYFARVGEDTVGSVFGKVLGMLDLNESEDLEYEPEYLLSLGFEEAAESLEAMVDEVMVLKDALQPIWNEPLNNEDILIDIENRATDHLEANYDDEAEYIETVLASIDSAIDIFAGIASGAEY